MKTIRKYLFHLSFKKYISLIFVLLCSSISQFSMATEKSEVIQTENSVLALGTPSIFLNKIGVKSAAKNQRTYSRMRSDIQVSQVAPTFTLIDSYGQDISVVADNFSVEVDGTLSMNGQVVNKPNSKYILQGNNDKVYGWVILTEQNIAYEYTTERGQLSVKEVAVTDIHPECDFGNHKHMLAKNKSRIAFPAAFASTPHAGSYPGTHVGQLESRPGSSYVIYLDTSRVMSNGVPYDVSKEFMWTTWQIVAASFSMFDVNVTTNWNVYNSAAPSRRGGATMYRETGRSSCHYAFGTSTFCTLYRESDAYGQGRIAAHELGHLFHLAHDGGYPGGEYHSGIADFQWVPVMGNIWMATSWPNALYQWSKGEYSGATNREDDFSILTSFIPFKGDDISGVQALVIDGNGTVSADNNTGQIERNTDSDHFSFTIGASGGYANLTIDRTEHIGGGMLDVQAYIRDSSGAVVAQSNKSVNRAAQFNEYLNQGTYTIEVTGGAEGTPYHGFSKYSSLGYYAIEGIISGDDGGNLPAINNLENGATLSGTSQLFTWDVGNATGFWFYAGSTQGGQEYYRNDEQINGSSHTVTGLPTDGSTVYITFHYLLNGEWSQKHYHYKAASDISGVLGITSPAQGDTLTGSAQTFTWNTGDATGFWFYAGSTQGAQDYYRNPEQLNGTSHTVTGLPTDGSTVHITFHYLLDNAWSQIHYSYIADNDSSCDIAPAKPSTPVNSAISSTAFTANWNTVSGATSYSVQLWINDSEWQTIDTALESEYDFDNLLEGSTQYVRINAENSCGISEFSEWSVVTLLAGECNAAPDVPTGLAGNSQTISWNEIATATSYDIQYWTGVWSDHGSSTTASYNLGLTGTQYVRIRAANNCGESDYTSWISVN